MKKIIISVILVSGIFTTILSSAKDSISTTGFIFGINAGYAAGFNKEENISTNFFSGNFKSGNINFGGFVGYDYAISKTFSFGAEVDLNYTPNIYKIDIYVPEAGSLTRKYNTLNFPLLITGKATFPIGFNLFVKGGVNYQKISSRVTSCSDKLCDNAVDRNGNNWNGVLATGFGYQMSKFNIFAQYMYIFGNILSELTERKSLAQSNITAGISYVLAI